MGIYNAIEFSAGLDLAPLQRDWSRAEQIGKTGAARVQSAMANATKAGFSGGGSRSVDWAAIAAERAQIADFARSHTASGRRVRTARDFAPAPAGKYPAPFEVEGAEDTRANRRMIRGLGAGLTAVAGVHQLAEAYKAATAAASSLEARVNSITKLTGSGSFRGVGEMEANLREASSATEQILRRKFSEVKRDERDPMMTFGFLARKTRQFVTGDSDAKEEEQIARLRAQASKDISGIAQKQQAINEAQAEEVSGSERQAAILRAEINLRERLLQLAEMESTAGVDNSAARDAEMARFQNEVSGIGRRFDLKKQEEEVENRILNLHASTLTTEQQSLVAIREKINLLKQRMERPGSEEKRTEIGTEIHRLENQESRMQYGESNKSWGQRTAEMQAQQHYQSFVNRQSAAPNAYLSHPDAYARRDILGNRVDQAGNVMGAAPKTPETGPVKAGGDPAAIVSKLDALIQEFRDAWK